MFLLLFVLGVAQARDTLDLAITFRPSGDSSAPVLVRLALPRGRDTATLDLPNEWAGRTKLYENIAGLRAVGAGASVAATGNPARVFFTRPSGSGAEIEWKLRATLPSSSAGDAHNHSDLSNGVAQLVGREALVLPDLESGPPVRATIRVDSLPAGWPIVTSFGRVRDADGRIVARGMLNNLRDAIYLFPLAPGTLRVHTVNVNGGALTIALRGRRTIPDSVVIDGVRRVVEAERAYWGGPIPRDYLASIGVGPRGSLGGVHFTKTVVADIDSLRPAMDDGVLDLFAHELMHEWIGDSMHPAPRTRGGELG